MMLGIMRATYIDHMGSDLTVVNAARVSFKKKSDWEREAVEYDGTSLNMPYLNVLREKDVKLIKYLASHGHWTPFAHPQVQFHFKAPIFVARQLVKHQVGMVWNEVSGRYVTEGHEFYVPDEWRAQAEDKKQGSSKEVIAFFDDDLYIGPIEAYHKLIDMGVSGEQARLVLPLATFTEWYWTGSLAAWARVYKLRVAPDAQQETREIVEQINEPMQRLFPVSWAELTK